MTDDKDEKADKAPAKKSRKKHAKDVGGGTEEVLGSIDDFPMA
jgi:transcription factor TFIIIB component B''